MPAPVQSPGQRAGGSHEHRILGWIGLIGMLCLAAPHPGRAASSTDLMTLLEQRNCAGCKLQDADLVRADLRDSDLRKAQLQRANLSGAQLDGADLRGANLSFTALMGASLRGANLRGAILTGTDLREADLSDAQLDTDALARSHWRKAIGVEASASSYADLHNNGVEEALSGRYPEAEQYFNKALLKQPDAAITWIARGITRVEQANRSAAAQDFSYAATLYEQQGQADTAKTVREAAKLLSKDPKTTGNGWGSKLFGGAAALLQQLAPLAVKYFAPVAF